MNSLLKVEKSPSRTDGRRRLARSGRHYATIHHHGLFDSVRSAGAYQHVLQSWSFNCAFIRYSLFKKKSKNEKFQLLFLFSTWNWLFGIDFCGPVESEESDEEDGTGNVTRMVMRPPGHSGKAKKGHLCLDASFETGQFIIAQLVTSRCM